MHAKEELLTCDGSQRVIIAASGAKISSLRRVYTVCSAPGCYYSFKVITQLKEISLMREGGGRVARLMGPIVLLIHVSDFREGGKHFGVEHVCVHVYIYIYMCVCVCVSVCVWRGGWFSQEEFGVV